MYVSAYTFELWLCTGGYEAWEKYVVVNFLSQVVLIFSFVSTSLAYITVPKNKRKIKLLQIKN